MSVPRFGGGGAKCKTCEKTVYVSEKIEYDGVTYHQDCFKCLECKKVVGLSAVAMIKGDLYCKNCFLRIFQREGKYSSFGEKTLPKAEGGADRSRANTTEQQSASTAPSVSPTSSSGSTASVTPAPERRSSVVLPCVVADCKGARVARKNYCLEHLNAGADQVPASLNDLFDAISNKNVDKVKEILAGQKSTEILFKLSPKNITPIEAAFTGIQNSRACGEAMLNWLQSKVSELEKAAPAQ